MNPWHACRVVCTPLIVFLAIGFAFGGWDMYWDEYDIAESSIKGARGVNAMCKQPENHEYADDASVECRIAKSRANRWVWSTALSATFWHVIYKILESVSRLIRLVLGTWTGMIVVGGGAAVFLFLLRERAHQRKEWEESRTFGDHQREQALAYGTGGPAITLHFDRNNPEGHNFFRALAERVGVVQAKPKLI